MTVLLVAFLAAHGLVHLVIWAPWPQPTDQPPPFQPDHSAVLTAVHAPARAVRALALGLAVAATAAYLLAAAMVGFDVPGAELAALTAALLGLLIKLVYFNPWLLIGMTLDGLVLTSAVAGWPVSLT